MKKFLEETTSFDETYLLSIFGKESMKEVRSELERASKIFVVQVFQMFPHFE